MSTMINPHTLEQIELDLETARGQFAGGQISATVDPATKLLAAAIAQAGAEIAIALASAPDRNSPEGG
jgi:hypothetical protein